MSQDTEENNAKNKSNNCHNNHHNHNHNYNYNVNGHTIMSENNQQVMPLYENCILNKHQNNSNNKNNTKPDHSLLERSQIKSDSFNYEYHFARDTASAADLNENVQARDSTIPLSKEQDYEYENVNFRYKQDHLDKKILLQKYFRSALVGPRSNIYENLCRGCNYGVFSARGPLCTFCECIVNGVSAIRSDTPEDSVTTSNNIYENICENCGVIYSGADGSECKCVNGEIRDRFENETEIEQIDNEIEVAKETERELEIATVLKHGSEELLLSKEKKKVKLNKSKSFNKSTKPKIFTSFWDTLRKPKNTSNSAVRKPLEIIHHVDGYDQVFHTKETFDLQKICELKRSGTSSSDQHIYGRLKQNDLSLSHDEFNSTQSLTQSVKSVTTGLPSKRPRISKVKFLRTQPQETPDRSDSTSSIYLCNSIIHWMTSLRREIHTYNTPLNGIGEDTNVSDTVCYPKSIPSKSVLISYKAPVTNHPETLQNFLFADCGSGDSSCISSGNSGSDLTEILKSTSHNSMTFSNSAETEVTHEQRTQQPQTQTQQQQSDYYQWMVEEFIANILNRQQQMLQSKDNKQIDNVRAMAGVINSDEDTKNNNSNTGSDIPLRQNNATTTRLTTTTTPMTMTKIETGVGTGTTKNNNNKNSQHNNNRHKRQGMYLRLENHHDHLQLQRLQQQHNNAGEEQINLHNNRVNNAFQEEKSVTQRELGMNMGLKTERHTKEEEEKENNSEYDRQVYSPGEHNTVTTPDTTLTSHNADLTLVSRCLKQPLAGWDLLKSDKRRGIHERNVLEAFEALLQQETQKSVQLTNKKEKETISNLKATYACLESQNCEKINKSTKTTTIATTTTATTLPPTVTSIELQTFGDNPKSITLQFPSQLLDVIQLINHQQMSNGLNTLLICYDQYLIWFLRYVYQINTNTRSIVHTIPNKQLVRKFQHLYKYCERKNSIAINTKTATITPTTTTRTATPSSSSALVATATLKPKPTIKNSTCVSSNLKLDLNVTNTDNDNAQKREKRNESLLNESPAKNCSNNLNTLNSKSYENHNTTNQRVKTPPQVPKRDPKTKLSPTIETKQFSLTANAKMTVPSNNLKTDTKTDASHKEEESIYQPIWKFETKGKVNERYQTDDDYYDIKSLKEKLKLDSPNSEIPKILISDDILHEEEEDHQNWEPDEEFVFTKQMNKQRSSSITSEQNSTIRSDHSSNASIATNSSLSGSTITEFASSTATLASTVSTSLRHYLFRNIGIFYSLTEPKLRAIIYDYDRVHSSRYFAKPAMVTINNDSGLGKSPSPPQCVKHMANSKTSPLSSASSSPSASAKSSPISLTKRENFNKSYTQSESDETLSPVAAATTTAAPPSVLSSMSASASTKANAPCNTSVTTPHFIPSSVQAWKYQLLDINYMEDEEDLIVSECEILRAQQVKEDIDQSSQTQPQQFMQRFKSRSTENFLDLPIEDDKKTITERLANMYTRFSPIQRGILNINGRSSPKAKRNRAVQSTSLYLEDGIQPKYPIFGAPLDQLELQQNVPRFVVDAVDYIERKDRITQDGIYRACGNKFSIDELKQKLSKSYVYDSKLVAADDIHTVTSLLKQFFRDLPEPVIPQDIYDRITSSMAEKQGPDAIRTAIEQMKEPNKSTLRFLIKHLTNVAACSSSNRMNASNVAIVWGPSLFTKNDTYDMIGRMNTLTKVLIESYERIFDTNERLL